jgi:ethanolamine utilization protein EutA
MTDFPQNSDSSYNTRETLNSIGIDIGSTTTQLVFSELTMGFVEEKHKYDIIKRDIIHQSKIYFTPFNNDFTIDGVKLSEIINSEYNEAELSTEDIQTGAVIITGVAALRHNARTIVNLFADQMGKFVCATAGPNYEAILAAYGSGAVELSEFEMKTVLNVDVGGGTSKIAVIKNGEIVDTASLFVGARHVTLDCEGRVIKIEEPAKIVANSINVKLVPGRIIPHVEQRMLTSSLVEALFEVIENRGLSPTTKRLLQTQPLKFNGKADIIVFSGGVSEYIYKYESKNYGDLGILLGEETRKRICHLNAVVAEPTERIRATVIGESQYTVQISGTTNLISSLDLLPIKNLPVVAPNFDSSMIDQQSMEEKMMRAIE